MKKGWIIISIVLILIGLAVCFAASVMLGFDFKKLNAQPLEPNTYAVSESFDHISIRADTEKITFLPAEDGKCRVICTETRKQTHEVEVQDNTLTVRTVDKRTWFNRLGLNLGTPTVEVYLPEKAYTVLAIETDTGDITIPEDFTFGSLRINGDTADVRCNASAPDGMEINLSTGDIDLAEIKTGDLSFDPCQHRQGQAGWPDLRKPAHRRQHRGHHAEGYARSREDYHRAQHRRRPV